MPMRRSLLLLLIIPGACTLGEARTILNAPTTTRSTPHDHYEQQNQLDARMASWRDAARRALRERLALEPSFREFVYFDGQTPSAVGYRLTLQGGQRVSVLYRSVSGNQGALFADVFQEMEPPSAMFRHTYSPRADADSFDFQAGAAGEYVIRLQPGLDRHGLVEVAVLAAAGLTFPVMGSSLRAVGSWFGAARDGGARHHEGLDIFAPRGTTVVAAAAGTITSVQSNSVGGRVVWQRDDARNLLYYYAHLNAQLVAAGDRVKAGDRIGTVGNTGNASAARPHLHFSIYQPGMIALDPKPFLHAVVSDSLVAVTVDLARLGTWARIADSSAALRSSPRDDAALQRELAAGTKVRLIGALAAWHRVELEDGTVGFVGGWQIAQQ